MNDLSWYNFVYIMNASKMIILSVPNIKDIDYQDGDTKADNGFKVYDDL